MKFYSLFRKELKEMLSLQTIITMIVTVVVLVMAGQAMSGAISDSSEKASDLTICDLDKTEFTENVLNSLKATAKAGDGKITVGIGFNTAIRYAISPIILSVFL